MRAAIYTRVSKDARGEARSVAEQEAECRAWVEREGWTLDGVWSDNDRSASRYAKKDRPGWKALTDRLEAGGIDLLVVWEPSRATRDRRVWAALAAVCEEQGTKFGHAGRVYDLADGDDAFQLDLAFALATRESATTRKRVERAMRARRESGRPHGRLLYGYSRLYDSRTGALLEQIVRDDQAAVVREAARRVAAGETPYAVAQDFNARGIPSPRAGRWDLTRIRRVVTNPGYIGQRTHDGQVIGPAMWPPILDEETFYACVSRLTDPGRRTNRDSAVRHLLSGVAVCGVCGGRVRVQKNRTHLAYLCVNGFHVSRHKGNAEAYVAQVIIARLSLPDAVELVTAPDSRTAEVRAAAAEAAALRARLEAFYDQAAEGELTPAALSRIEKRLLPELEAAERRARPTLVLPVLREVIGSGDVAKAWDGLALSQQREIVGALCAIRLLPVGAGHRTFRPESVEITWR